MTVHVEELFALIDTVEENGLSPHHGPCPDRCRECAISRAALADLRARVGSLAAQANSDASGGQV